MRQSGRFLSLFIVVFLSKLGKILLWLIQRG